MKDVINYNDYRTHLMTSLKKIHKVVDSCECPDQLEVAINMIDLFTDLVDSRAYRLYKLHKHHFWDKKLKKEYMMYYNSADASIKELCAKAQSLMGEFVAEKNKEMIVPGFSGMINIEEEINE